MHQIENHELRTPGVFAFQLQACSEIRVVTGRLWLTLEGFPEDVWLQAGEAWTLPANGRLWLSAEPVGDFRIVRFTAARQSRHDSSCRTPFLVIVEALKKLAVSGTAFFSRGDKSGPHAAELRLWELAGLPDSKGSDCKECG
ncbi:DUF2917 domain-containing protein [Rhodoferax ferrireducens]|uniref:DUF2917 domain-containing protein n=1 Tax=Rhodoferax ferrireducens TaxID=192843 RepID=UPI000E0D200C